MVKNVYNNIEEIDLIDTLQTIWIGKWKIAAAIFISFTSVYFYDTNQIKKFTATTEIRAINTFEENKYLNFNNYLSTLEEIIDQSIQDNKELDQHNQKEKISKKQLLDLYIELLNDRSLFEDAIRKFNLLDKNQYSDKQTYEEAIVKLASTIEIFSTSPSDDKKIDEQISYIIQFRHYDIEKWKSVLKYVDEIGNRNVKEMMQKYYNHILSNLKRDRAYQLEDLKVKIDNLIIDYERQTYDRLTYLKEQSDIARKLDIAKSTVEIQTFDKNTFISEILKSDSPLYLRGYEAIDKEIELINARTDNQKKAFIKGLFQSEKIKRTLEQNKSIDRAELIFLSTPLGSSKDNFTAASTNVLATKFEYKNDKKILLISVLFGSIIGVFYVLISTAFQSRKYNRKKTN